MVVFGPLLFLPVCCQHGRAILCSAYTVKKGWRFSLPSRAVITKLSLAMNNLIILGQGEFGYARLVTSRHRTGKSLTFFYSVGPEMVLPDYSGRCNCTIRLGTLLHPWEGIYCDLLWPSLVSPSLLSTQAGYVM